jgi:hypothetical protein
MKEKLRRGTVKIGTVYKKLKEGVANKDVSKELSAIEYAEMAITELKKISKDDPLTDQALYKVLEWMLINNPNWAKEVVGKSRGIIHKHIRTMTKSDIKTSVTTNQQKSHGSTLKENLKGVQASLWENEA